MWCVVCAGGVVHGAVPLCGVWCVQVVWFTALFPYVVLLVLLCRGAMLPGAGTGLRYYLTPNFTRLASSEVSHRAVLGWPVCTCVGMCL